MAASLQSLLLALDSKGNAPKPNKPCSTSCDSSWNRAMEHHALRRKKKMVSTKKMKQKKRGSLQGGPSREAETCVERRIRALQRLVPSGEAMGIDGLFREAADYIACLQMQVQVMNIMVKVLSGDSDA